MDDIIIPLATLVLGAGATLLISRFYHRRSVEKELTPYIRYGTSVFAGMDPMLRERLKIRYQDMEVEDLIQLEFLVVNEGHRAIRDCIEPFALNVAEDAEVLDARIVHVEPEGRTVDANIVSPANPSRIEYPFPLLNSGEYFLSKVLFRGDLSLSDVSFTITSDDLPPELEGKSYPLFSIRGKEDDGVSWVPVGVGAGLILGGLAVLYLLSLVFNSHSALFPMLGESFQPEFLGTTAVMLAFLMCIFLVLIGGVLAIAEGFSGVFPWIGGGPPVKLPRGVPEVQPWIGPVYLDETTKDQSGIV